MKSERVRWTENVARLEETKNTYKFLAGKPDRRARLRLLDVDINVS